MRISLYLSCIAGVFLGACGPQISVEDQALDCAHKLRMIDGAKEQVALEEKLREGDVISSDQIKLYVRGGVPKCPSKGSYDIGAIGRIPRCSHEGHSIGLGNTRETGTLAIDLGDKARKVRTGGERPY
jgi:hypothetical protein